jgi:protein tyrosine/serine phosphatase
MLVGVRWILGSGIAVLVTVVPFFFYRWEYTHSKRLREVVPGVFYRSGQMTATGFADAVQSLGIRTIVNLQDEYPDPDVAAGYFTGETIAESDLCQQLGVRYLYLPPDLIPRRQIPAHRPVAIDRFLDILTDPSNYPLLIHCRAGLHRTGVLTAVYRMEMQGWSPGQAIREMKANGFGEWPCTSANDYISEYILTYRRGTHGNVSPTAAPGVVRNGPRNDVGAE